MSLRIRRGTDAQRTSIVFDAGELIYTTDTKRLYVGDGITSGGTAPEQNIVGNGLSYNTSTKHIDVSLATFSSDSLTEGSNNRYFTNQRAQDAFGALVANGTFNGVTVQYDSVAHALNITVAGDYDAVVMDTNPQLGGNLSLNSHNIGGTGNISITGTISATSFGNIVTSGLTTNGSLFTIVTNNALTNGVDGSYFDLNYSRGTTASPVTVNIGDFLGGYRMQAYTAGSYKSVAVIGSSVNSTATLTDVNPASTMIFAIAAGGSNFVEAYFDNTGTFNAPILRTGNTYTTSPDTRPSSPALGMIIFETTTHTFQGWNGTTWATLG